MLKIIVRYGLIAGLIILVPYVISYVIGYEATWALWVSGILQLMSLAAIVYIAIKAVREIRAINDNVVTFSDAFATSVGTLVIVALISTLFSFILQNYIEPDYGEKLKQTTIQKTQERFEKYKVPEEEQQVYLDKLQNTDYSYTLPKAMKYLGYSILGCCAIALIIAASVKKDMNDAPPQ
jgi:hypothetical protein